MQFDASASQRVAIDCSDDTDTARRMEAATRSQLARKDDQPERDRPEAGLLERDQLFRTTFERAVVGIAHVSPEGRWLRFNQRLCDIVGYSREELATRTWQDLTHPDDLADDLDYVQRILAGELHEYEMDKRFLRTDGALIWVHLTVMLVRTPQGEPDYFISMVQDISERKRLEQERARLFEQERSARAEAEAALSRAIVSETKATERAEQLHTILETMADGVAVYDAAGRPIQVTNRAYRELYAVERSPVGYEALTTFERAGLLHLRDAATGAPLPFADTPVGRALRGEVVTGPSADIRARALDGRELEVHSSAAPLRDPNDGRIAGAVLVVRDMTWRKHLEREREAAYAAVEATNAQLRALQALTDTALSHLALDDLLRELLGRVSAVMGVDHVGILLLDEDGQTLTARAAHGLGEEDVGRVQVPVRQGFLGRIAASRTPLIVDDLSAADFDEATPPILREQLRSVVGVPLLVEDHAVERGEKQGEAGVVESHPVSRMVGILAVGSTVPRRFTQADVPLLQRAADRVALAIDRARLYANEQGARRCAEAALARVQASEAQAAERAERLNTILETMTDGVAVYDAEGRPVQLTNRAYRGLFAVDHAPAGFETLTTFDRVRLLDVRDAATNAPLLFADTPVGRALRGEVVTGPSGDVRMRAFDGRELEVNDSAAPLRDADGQLVGAVLVLRDVTWRKRLEREREAARVQAERQADQLDRIFEAAADGLLVWDAEGRLVRENPAARRILGLDAAPPGFEQLPVRERLALYATRDEQDRPVSPEEWPIMCVLRGKAGTGAEARDFQIRALDGREIELTSSTAPLRDREGQLVGAVCVLHDQTERKRLERERAAARADELAAREASRRMEQFLATAAHDLRTPLTAIIGYLDLAQRQTERLAATVQQAYPDLARQVATVHTRLADADHGAERLAQLLALLFDTAALHADRLELHRAFCDLAALVHECVTTLRVAAPGRSIHLHTPAPSGDQPIPVEVDAARIGQVITNFVSNALKYAPPDQPIDVSVLVRGSRARVAVCDRGPGIPKGEQARVWELFHRVPGVTAQSGTHGGSLGLGLHICKAIVEAHGGRVGVKSTVGQGSTFWFTLPLSGPDA